jgi:Fe2+ or Zn2+ uptake regulation protein
MTAVNQYTGASPPTDAYTESVFTIINQNSGRLNFKDLYSKMVENGSSNRVALYRAIATLTKEGKIRRIKGIGKTGIDYFYHDSSLYKLKGKLRETTGVIA